MVEGIESFREAFKDFTDCYTVIGGAACDILMTDNDEEFRATHDIDMILILEDKKKEFSEAFWNYIKQGGYKCGWKNNDAMHFYRFTEPNPGYPSQIELFSRRQDYQLDVEQGVIPIHIDDDISSLSAILLNDDFYNFMMEGRKVVNGISILNAEYLIPFKMYAWLDLTERKAKGEFVKEKDLKKHKYDVFRLMGIIDETLRINLTGLVKAKVSEFLERIQSEQLSLDAINSVYTKDEAIQVLRTIYS